LASVPKGFVEPLVSDDCPEAEQIPNPPYPEKKED
jgi:hypothetical protein